VKNREKCQPNLTDPDAYEQQLQQKCKGQALRFVEPWLLAFVNPDAKQGRCQPVMVCYALPGESVNRSPFRKLQVQNRWMHLSKLVAHRHRWRGFFGCMLSKLQMTYIVTQINFLQPWYFLKYWH